MHPTEPSTFRYGYNVCMTEPERCTILAVSAPLQNVTWFHFFTSLVDHEALRAIHFPELRVFASAAIPGANTCAFLVNHPTIISLQFSSWAHTRCDPFSLPTHTLPALTAFLGLIKLAAVLVPHRPIRQCGIISVYRVPEHAKINAVLATLALSTRRLEVFEAYMNHWDEDYVYTLAEHLPSLSQIFMHQMHDRYGLQRNPTEVSPRARLS
jgi:hypothetical protein